MKSQSIKDALNTRQKFQFISTQNVHFFRQIFWLLSYLFHCSIFAQFYLSLTNNRVFEIPRQNDSPEVANFDGASSKKLRKN